MKLLTFLGGHSGIALDQFEITRDITSKLKSSPIIHSPIGNDFYIENNPEKELSFIIKNEYVDVKDLTIDDIYGEIKCVIKKRIENGRAHYAFIIVNLSFYKRPTPQVQKNWKYFVTQLVRQKDQIEEICHCEEVTIVFNEKLTREQMDFFSRFLNVEKKMKKSFISIVNKKYEKPDLYDNVELRLCTQKDLNDVKELLSDDNRSILGGKIVRAIKSSEVYLIKNKSSKVTLGMLRIRKSSMTLKDVQKQNESLKFCLQMVPLINYENKLTPKKRIERLYISDFYLNESINERYKIELTRTVFYRLMNNKYFEGAKLLSLAEHAEWLKSSCQSYFSVNTDSFIYNLTTKF